MPVRKRKIDHSRSKKKPAQHQLKMAPGDDDDSVVVDEESSSSDVEEHQEAPGEGDDDFDSADDHCSDATKEDSDEDFEEDDAQEEESSGDEEEEEQLVAQASRSSAKRKSPRKAQHHRTSPRRQAKKSRKQEESDDEEESSSEDDFVPTSSRARARSKATQKRRGSDGGAVKKATKKEASPFESSSEEDEDDVPLARLSAKRAAEKSKASRAVLEDDSSSAASENEEDESPSRPMRNSARKAVRKMKDISKIDGSEEARRVPKRRSKKVNEDEEEYDEHEESSSHGSDDLDLAKEDMSVASSVVEEEKKDDEAGVGYVDDDNIGSADSSDDDDGDKKPAARVYASPELETISPRKHSQTGGASSDDDSSVEQPRSSQNTAGSSPFVPQCLSKYDAITEEELPEKHICYYTPDGQCNQCFSLETFRKVALMAVDQGRGVYDENGKLRFLQPPHFRSAISEDLEDQIASRFGRDALDIHGPYYNRPTNLPFARAGEFERIGSRSEDDDFVQQVQKYIGGIMGSQDLYVCPLCYAVACHEEKSKKQPAKKKAQTKPSRRSDDECSIDLPNDTENPMEILASVDNYEYAIASMFCFKTAAKVKKHLREDHHVNTRIVKGNDFYERYKIRTSGGLLQRYIKHAFARCTVTKQGFLQMYWAEGWNYDYVLLLEQVREADMLREEFSAQTDEEPGSEGNRVGTALDFFDSFASETPALWELMSGPFTSDDRDMNDFVANEDESEDASDGDPRDLFRQQQQQEAERERRESVLAAKRAVRRFQADQSEDEEVQDEASLDEEEVELEEEDPSENEEEEEDDVVGGYAEVESEEEEDDWMQKKRASLEAKRRASRGQPAENGRTKTKGVIAIMDSDDEEDISPRSVAKSKKKKKRIIDDSDEE